MTHKIFKVINFYYIHLDDKHRLCPLADYLCDFHQIDVVEVRYYQQVDQGVIIVRCCREDAEAHLNRLVEQYKERML